MRAIFLASAMAMLVAVSAEGQTCNKTPPPVTADLFPGSVGGIPVEFESDPDGGSMGMYRPQSEAEWDTQPWVMVSIEANPTGTRGVSAGALRTEYRKSSTPFIDVDGWPVAVTQQPVGDQFEALKGSLDITVLVENGDHGQKSQAMAMPVLQTLLAKVPCG